MTIATVITLGFGTFGNVNALPVLGYSIGAAVVVSDAEYICFTDENISVSHMVDEAIACTRMIDEEIGICAGHAPALAITLPETQWFFSATGDDTTGDGSADAPWQVTKLQELIDDGFFTGVGEWVEEYNVPAGLVTVTSDALGITWYEQFAIGNRRLINGDVFIFQTNVVFPIGGAQLNLSSLVNPTLRGVNGGIRISNRPDIGGATFVRPNAGLYPAVWKYVSAGLDNACCTDNGTFVPIILDSGSPFVVEADALAAMQATPNRSWHSATGFYIHMAGSLNPNTAGHELLITAEQSGAENDMIHMGSGLIENLTPTAGPLGDTSAPVIQSALSIETGGIVALHNVTIDGGSRWGIARAGSGLTGMLVMHNVYFRGLFVHGYLGGQTTTHINDEPTNTSGTGSLRILGNPTYHADGAWHNSGGTVTSTAPTLYNQLSYFAQNAGASPIFKQLYFVGANLGKLDVIGYDRLHLKDGDWYSVFGVPLDGFVENCEVHSARLNIEGGSVWVYDGGSVTADGTETTPHELSGSVTFQNGCDVDLSLFPFSTVVAMFQKQDNGCELVMNDSTLRRNVAQNNAALVSGMDDDLDTLAIDNLTFVGLGTTKILHQHTNGAIQDYTYDEAVTAGYVT